MSAIFSFEKGAAKKHKFFIFLKGCYFVMGSPIDMNVDAFLETSVDFLKSVVLQLFPKYSKSNECQRDCQKYVKIKLPLKKRWVVLVFSIWM